MLRSQVEGSFNFLLRTIHTNNILVPPNKGTTPYQCRLAWKFVENEVNLSSHPFIMDGGESVVRMDLW